MFLASGLLALAPLIAAAGDTIDVAIERDETIGEVLQRFARENDAIVLVPAGAPPLDREFGHGFRHAIPRSRLWSTMEAILAFYEMGLRRTTARDVYVAWALKGGRSPLVRVYGGPPSLRVVLRRDVLDGPPRMDAASRTRVQRFLAGGWEERRFAARLLRACGEPVPAAGSPKRLCFGCILVDERVWLRYPQGVRPDATPGRYRVRVIGFDAPLAVELRYSPATLGRVRRLRRGALHDASERMLERLARAASPKVQRRARRLLAEYGRRDRE